MRALIAIPVYNEQRYVRRVLEKVLGHAGNVLVVDDGSSDDTTRIAAEFPVDMIRHVVNRGYGRSIRDAFRWALCEGYDWLITMDCDEQHEPEAIPTFLEAATSTDADIISGSRYITRDGEPAGDQPPPDRRAINQTITAEFNCRLGDALGTKLTDSFCGYKAYRVAALQKLRPTINGYAFPVQFWVQAAAAGLTVKELPVKLIYNDPNRSFGATLDDPSVRLAHYRRIMHREIRRLADRLPARATLALDAPACRDKPDRGYCGR